MTYTDLSPKAKCFLIAQVMEKEAKRAIDAFGFIQFERTEACADDPYAKCPATGSWLRWRPDLDGQAAWEVLLWAFNNMPCFGLLMPYHPGEGVGGSWVPEDGLPQNIRAETPVLALMHAVIEYGLATGRITQADVEELRI